MPGWVAMPLPPRRPERVIGPLGDRGESVVKDPHAGAMNPLIAPPARVSGTLTPALARRATHAPADDWATDVLTLADPPWGGQPTTWPGR